jgi:phage terminase Nu1 subunit (DNA packaging protein)
MAPPTALLGPSDLAKLLKVTRQAIHDWRKQGLPCRIVSGSPKFTVAEVMEWRLERAREVARSNDAPDEAKERARKMRADADLSELKGAQMRGELVPVADVTRETERLCAVLRARVLSIRGRWAPKVLGLGTMAEATAAMDALTADVLAALQDSADELEDEPPDEEAAA